MAEFFIGFICLYWGMAFMGASFVANDRQITVVQRGIAAVAIGISVFFLTNSPL